MVSYTDFYQLINISIPNLYTTYYTYMNAYDNTL